MTAHFFKKYLFLWKLCRHIGMRKRLASTDPETVSGFRQTISGLKDQLGTFGYSVGPVVGLLSALVVGFFNPQAFDNDYFVILILFFGIFWMLFYGGGPLENDDADNSTTIKRLKPTDFKVRNEVRRKFELATENRR